MAGRPRKIIPQPVTVETIRNSLNEAISTSESELEMFKNLLSDFENDVNDLNEHRQELIAKGIDSENLEKLFIEALKKYDVDPNAPSYPSVFTPTAMINKPPMANVSVYTGKRRGRKPKNYKPEEDTSSNPE